MFHFHDFNNNKRSLCRELSPHWSKVTFTWDLVYKLRMEIKQGQLNKNTQKSGYTLQPLLPSPSRPLMSFGLFELVASCNNIFEIFLKSVLFVLVCFGEILDHSTSLSLRQLFKSGYVISLEGKYTLMVELITTHTSEMWRGVPTTLFQFTQQGACTHNLITPLHNNVIMLPSNLKSTETCCSCI